MKFLDNLRSKREIEKLSHYFSASGRQSVAVIGNAQSIFDHQHGALIDSHDLVIRMNSGVIRDPAVQGSRTTILALSQKLTPGEVTAMFGAVDIFWMTPKRKNLHPGLRKKFPLQLYPKSCWEALSAELEGARPSTGAMVIDMVARRFPAKRLSLFGFDFKKTKTFYLAEDHLGPHRFDLEERWISAAVKQAGGTIY